jgi:hypothetical protein
MARRGGGAGYGEMAFTHYLEKTESSDIPEDDNLMYNHMRDTLKDLSCDEPFFEEHQKRDRYDAPLTFRYSGKRCEAQPYLEDGTFLDFHALEQDERSLMTAPDLSKAKAHQRARGKFINFKNDNCPTVPESGIAPISMVRNIKQGMHRVKDQMKIFDESLTSWNHNGGASVDPIIKPSLVNFYDVSSELPAPEGPTQRTRQSHVNDADCLPIGFHSTPDQRVKIASYAKIAMGAKYQDSNWYKNRTEAEFDAKQTYVPYENRYITTADALAIIDIVKQKKSFMDKNQNSNTWKEALVSANTGGINSPTDTVGLKHSAVASQSLTANARLNSIGANIKQTVPNKPLDLMGKSLVNHKIFDTMVRANNKTMKQDEYNDLRDQVMQSAVSQAINDIAQTLKNKNSTVVPESGIDRFSSDIVVADDSKMKNVMNYKTLNLKNVVSTVGITHYDQHKKEDKTRATVKRVLTSEVIAGESHADVVEGIGHNDGTRRHASVRMGSKSARRDGQTDTKSSEMLDI